VDTLRDELHAAKANRDLDDDVAMRTYNRLREDYRDALEEWEDARKSLLAFDKNVQPERREGEKALVSDVREWFQQLRLSIDIAIEATIKGNAQTAALVDSPEQFYIQAAEQYRAAKDNAVNSAVEHGTLPKWVAL